MAVTRCRGSSCDKIGQEGQWVGERRARAEGFGRDLDRGSVGVARGFEMRGFEKRDAEKIISVRVASIRFDDVAKQVERVLKSFFVQKLGSLFDLGPVARVRGSPIRLASFLLHGERE